MIYPELAFFILGFISCILLRKVNFQMFAALDPELESINKWYSPNWVDKSIHKDQRRLLEQHGVVVYASGVYGTILAYRRTSDDYYDDVLEHIQAQGIETDDRMIIDYAATEAKIQDWVTKWISEGCPIPEMTARPTEFPDKW